MKFNEKHSAIILERVFNCQDGYELIDLVSRQDKRRIAIHRVILMAASEYFDNLVRTNDATEKPEEFVIDSSGEVIKTVVDFCYSGHIDITDQNAEKCLKIATDGEMDLLLNACHDFYEAKLSTETVVDVLLIADKYNLDDLQRRASKLLCSDLEQVPVAQTLQLNPEMMLHLMRKGDEAVSSHSLVERLLSWFQYAEADRGEFMPKMLRLIRLEQLTAEFLGGTLEPLFKQFKCIELLYTEFKKRAMKPTSEKIYKAATNIWTGVALVANKLEYFESGHCYDNKFIVERYDDYLNKFTPHFTSPSINHEYQHSILYGNTIFAYGNEKMITYDMKTGKVSMFAPMNENRKHHTTILMGKSLYVLGGSIGWPQTQCLNSCECYDLEKATWQTIKSMDHTRRDAKAAILNGLIFIVGGLQNSTKFSTSVESYDPNTDQWTERMGLDVGTNQNALVAFDGMLYVFLNRHGVREYDPVRNIWTKIQSDYTFYSVVSANGRLFALTYDNRFGLVEINRQRIDFVELTKVDIPYHWPLSLQKMSM